MALNNQIIGSISGNLVADGDGNITGANFANITSNLQTFISNNGTDVKSVSIQSSTDANFTANYTLTLPVNDGSNGQSLTTDGTGVLTWTTLSLSSIENGNSNVVVYPNNDVVISASGSNNILTVDQTGIFVVGVANVSGDVQAGANVNVTSNINASTIQNGNSNITITANSNVTIASNNVANVVTITNGNLITGNGIGIILTSNNGTGIRQVQLKTSTDANFTGNYSLTLPVNDGDSGQALTTDGGGVLSWTNVATASLSNGNSNISILGNANINISSAGNANVFIVTGTGAKVNGTANVTGNIDTGGNVNVTTGQIISTRSGNLSNGAGQLYLNGASHNRIDFNTDGSAPPSNTTRSIGTKITLYPSVTSNKVDYAIGVDDSTLWYSVPENVSINYFKWYGGTRVIATLFGNGDFSANNIRTAANAGIVLQGNNGSTTREVTIIASTNASFTDSYTLTLPPNDGASGQYLQTDGTGVLSWQTVTSGGGISNGNSNVNIATANGNVDITAAGNTVLVVTGTGANINGTANITGNFSTTGANVTLGPVGNVRITGGSSGQYLQTDGSGTLSWVSLSAGSAITNGTSNVNIPSSGGNVNTSVAGNANILVVTGTGANITGYANITGNANIGGTANVTGNANVGNLGTATAIITTGNITTVNTGLVQNGNSNITITSNANVTITAAGNSTMIISNTGANITGTGNFSGNVSAANFLGNFLGVLANGNSNVSIPDANGNVNISSAGNANVVTVTGSNVILSNAVPLTITGNNGTNLRTISLKTTNANANFTANYTLILPANVGTSGQVLVTDGNNPANLSWSGISGGSTLVNGTSNIVITLNGNITMSSGGVSPILTVTPSNAQFNGAALFNDAINANGGVVVGNISGQGALTSTISFGNPDGNIRFYSSGVLAMNIANNGVYILGNGTANFAQVILNNPGNSANGGGQLYLNGSSNNRIDFNINGLAAPSNTTRSSGTKIVLYPAVDSGNVDYAIGIVGGALWHSVPGSGEVFKWYGGTTEVANLSGTGVLTATSLKTSVGGTFVAVANNGSSNRQVTIQASTDANFTGNYTLILPVNDGDSGQVLTTNGSGVLSWSAAGGSSSSISNGTSNVNIPSSGGNVNISSAGNANILVVTGTGANIAGTLNATGNANVGNLGTTTAIITTGNITTVNTGLVQNGNSNVAITANANVTITAKSNATMVISDTGANITGTANISGNANVGNLGTAGLTVTGDASFTGANVSLGAVANLHITGGTNGYVLSTNGSGDLSWIAQSGGANIANGTSNVNIPSVNGNVNISSAGNANVLVVTGTGANINGTGNFSGNTSVLNLSVTASNGDEGGEILLAKPQSNTTIAGTGVTVDIYQNRLRFFEQGGSARGYYLDITAGGSAASTNIIGGAVSVANIANGSSNVDIASSGGNVTVSVGGTSNVVVVSNTSANITGIANISGNIIGNGQLLIGTGTSSLLNPVAVFQGNGATFTQLALFNSQGNGSADLAVYGNNGDDNQSWTDIGFTGNTFNDANYTITAPGDGYLFVQGNASFGGNLVIATGNTGTTKDIIFATGGFQTANAKARLFNANGLFSVTGNISSGNANLGNLVTANFFSGQANLLTVDGGNAVGFRNVPINSQSAAYTTVLSDSGKAIFHPTGDATRTYTIDSNANVAYPLGTVLTFINMSASNISISINADTLYLTGNGATGNRTLAQYGMASAIKMTSGASNTWIISGSGLT